MGMPTAALPRPDELYHHDGLFYSVMKHPKSAVAAGVAAIGLLGLGYLAGSRNNYATGDELNRAINLPAQTQMVEHPPVAPAIPAAAGTSQYKSSDGTAAGSGKSGRVPMHLNSNGIVSSLPRQGEAIPERKYSGNDTHESSGPSYRGRIVQNGGERSVQPVTEIEFSGRDSRRLSDYFGDVTSGNRTIYSEREIGEVFSDYKIIVGKYEDGTKQAALFGFSDRTKTWWVIGLKDIK